MWTNMAGSKCSYFMMILNYCIIEKLEMYGVTNEALHDCVGDFKCFKEFIYTFRATS